jgi:hypothetical protein
MTFRFLNLKRLWGSLSQKSHPGERKARRQLTILDLMHDAILLETMRRWELETRKARYPRQA